MDIPQKIFSSRISHEEDQIRSMEDPYLIVVMPAMNEAASIGSVIDEINEVLTEVRHDVLVVDGHSTDETVTIARDKGAYVIRQYHRGYGDALLTGFYYARNQLEADIIAMMDADATYDPRDILTLMQPIVDVKADFSIGDRLSNLKEDSMTLLNRFGNRLISWIVRKLLVMNITDTQCGLRVFRSELVDSFYLVEAGMPFATEMLCDITQNGFRVFQAPVNYRPRVGDPKLTPFPDGMRILGTIIRLTRDSRPLFLFGVVASLLAVIGVVLGLDVSYQWFLTGRVTRIPTLLFSVLLILCAVVIFTFGMLADMIKGLKEFVKHGK